MANTYSKDANDFIDANAKTKNEKSLSEMAVNMAVSSVMGIVESTLIDFCPHKDVCSKQYARGGCDPLDCNYLSKYMYKIKHCDRLCYKK